MGVSWSYANSAATVATGSGNCAAVPSYAIPTTGGHPIYSRIASESSCYTFQFVTDSPDEYIQFFLADPSFNVTIAHAQYPSSLGTEPSLDLTNAVPVQGLCIFCYQLNTCSPRSALYLAGSTVRIYNDLVQLGWLHVKLDFLDPVPNAENVVWVVQGKPYTLYMSDQSSTSMSSPMELADGNVTAITQTARITPGDLAEDRIVCVFFLCLLR